ncbi:hypothetical protein [Pantoea cypripedii]|uniref:LF-82 n=1 Tax=Pantoea cypripedii TaxID=55209 RepID=A0A1X1EZA8_PANCY|nr:hypothetical protein [Pantoea cypripedii]MBP2194714.1 hypothetical protein [Pantoea cypripedii]ORM95095.1 hypothetical protein HA50_17775 [Pantoea cypripedii]
MVKSVEKFQIVYRGETLTYYKPGEWVFFQRPKEIGGGYWLGRTYDFVFMFELSYPVSLRQGILFMQEQDSLATRKPDSPDDFVLE